MSLRMLLERAWSGHFLYLELLTEVLLHEQELSIRVKRAPEWASPVIALRALRHGASLHMFLGGPGDAAWPSFERIEVSVAMAAALLGAVRFEEVVELNLGSAEVAARLLGRERDQRERERIVSNAMKAFLVKLDPAAARKALGPGPEKPKDNETLAMRRELALTELLEALNAEQVKGPGPMLKASIRPDERN